MDVFSGSDISAVIRHVTVLTYIREITGPNLGPQKDNPDWFSIVLLSPYK
jgi:hypothetical protein